MQLIVLCMFGSSLGCLWYGSLVGLVSMVVCCLRLVGCVNSVVLI